MPLKDAYVAGMPHLQWVDFDNHGYNVVDITPERVVVEWWAVDTVLSRTPGQRRVAVWGVRNGEPRLVAEDELAATVSTPTTGPTADR